MKYFARMILFSILGAFMLTGCFADNLAEKREKQADKGDGITIGVPVPLEFAAQKTNYLKGLELALADINAAGINGKQIKLEIADDKGVFKNAVDIAQAFAKNTAMVAVIGHWFSDICIPVSAIYEEAGMLAVVPTVSNPELMKKDYKYIFQNIPSDKKIAANICAYAKKAGYKNVVICYEDSSYGNNLAVAFENEARQNGIRVVDRSSGLVSEMQLNRAYDKWKALDFDAVLLALNMPEGAALISELRKLDRDVAILSGDGLDVSNFIEVLGKDAEGIVIATIYNPHDLRPELVRFQQRYSQKYGEQPDVWAMQGYDSLTLIARTIEQAGSCSPAGLANYLREMNPWETVSGKISFNDYGEVQGREVYKKIIVNGEFKYVD
ncbi:MAG: ABC transporter substrate-binding protein [Heliobacteriaceae bacterium]|nr:ABC transporter substrate-binding protein [Heliobacteriaceae bacterium]MDD4587159.1 ABC transporter substrate-binding protein [Heliobacteriaceae bacterium]